MSAARTIFAGISAFRNLVFGAALLAASALPVAAQTGPNFTYGFVPTTGQWNEYFAGKQDYLGAPPLLRTGGTMSGPLVTTPSLTSNAGLNVPPGVAPTSPNNGDVWTTASGLYVQINGATVGPLAQTGGTNVFTGQQTTQGMTTTSPGWYATITGDANARVRIGLNSTDVPSVAFGPGSAVRDTFIERAGPASVRLGAPDAASPVAQTLGVQNVAAGTSNGAGASLTLAGSRGTGSGAGGGFVFQVAPAGSSGSTQNALVTALTINTSGGMATAAAAGEGIGTLNLAGSLYNNGTAPTGTGAYVRGTGPTISGPTITGTISGGPAITAPTINAGTLTGTFAGTATFSGTNNYTGPFQIAGVSQTFPTSGLLVGTTDAQTLSSKTITASTNVLGGVTMTLGSDAEGDLYYRHSGVLTRLPIGSGGNVLEVVAGIPAWATITGAGTVNTAGTGLVLSGGGSTVNLALTNATLQSSTSGLNPTSTISTSDVMMGMGSTCYLTPTYSGRVTVTFVGTLAASGGFSSVQSFRFGTGTAPANAAAVTGTQVGPSSNVAGSGVSNLSAPFANSVNITGLTPGTAYWFDLALHTNNASNAAALINVSCNGHEY